MEKPILSISLLSCGQEPHIEDCLKGLVPLREKLGAEIIVVDTSTEKAGDVRDIIEQYADEVVDFDWCDDFSAARNAGLEKCTGEWFLFVDDDEVFEDVEAIADFFKSGEYKDYGTASIIIRNLGDEEGSRIYDSWVPRLYRMSKGARFEGRIHERFTPAEYPLKALDSVARHYGYIFKTYDEFLAHSERNLRLIEKELQSDPDNVHMRIHLLQEYVRKRNFARQREVAEECIHWLKGKHDRQSSIYRSICQGLILRADRMQGRLDDGIKRLTKLKKIKGYPPVAKAFFAQEGARLYDGLATAAATDDFLKKSRAEAEEYLSIYDGIKGEMDRHSDELAFYLASTFDEENLGDMRGIVNGVRPPERLGVQVLVSDDDEVSILQIPFSEWKAQVDRFMDASSTGDIVSRYQNLKSGQEHDDIRYDYFYARTDEKMLMAWVRVYDGVLPENLPDIENACNLFWERLEGFSSRIPEFCEKYGDRLTEEQKESLKSAVALAQKLSDLVAMDRSDAGRILSAVKDSLEVYPAFDMVLTYFAHLYGEYVKQGGGQNHCKTPLKKREDGMGRYKRARGPAAVERRTATRHVEINDKKDPNKPVLSISLLSCGHEPHVEECLKSIAALRDLIRTEIIVVDTSPEKSGEVRCIIEKYADEVVDFDWCDDFSAARNAGLSRCSGEWFMLVDDDEVIQDVSPIAEFFISNKYLLYSTASITIRNFSGADGSTYTDQWVPRMYRLVKGAHFESRIHERFTPSSHPIRAINALALHYGYIFQSAEESERHSARNIRLIEAELAEHPDDINLRVQLIQEYDIKGDFARTRYESEECLKWIRRLQGNEERQTSIYRGVCEMMLLVIDRLEERYDDGIDRFARLKKSKIFVRLPAIRAGFASEGAFLYDAIDDTASSRTEAAEYLSLYEQLSGTLDEHTDELSFVFSNIFNDSRVEAMRGITEGRRPEKGIRVFFQRKADEKYNSAFFEEMFAPESDPFAYETEAWEYAAGTEADVEEMILAFDFSRWRECADRFAVRASAKEISRVHACLKAIRKVEDVHYDYCFNRVDEWMLLAFVRDHDGELPAGYDDLSGTYALFRERLAGFCNSVLSHDKESGVNDGGRKKLAKRLSPLLELPDSEAAALLGGIKELLGMHPSFDPVLVYFVHLYGAYMKEKETYEKREADTEEMKQIIEVLQQKVDELVSAGMVEEAQKVLEEIQKYMIE